MLGKSLGALRALLLLPISVPALAQYVGTPPPSPAAPSAAVAQDLSIYPKNGQSREQQSADLYQCYHWAKDQTGFDPTQPGGGAAPSEAPYRRGQYRRAMTACLEAHGYDVRYAAPAPPPAPPPGSGAPPPPPYALPPAAAPQYSSPPQLTYHALSGQVEGGLTVPAGSTSDALHLGGNIGLGLTWFPSSTLPLGIRLDGSYDWFGLKNNVFSDSGFFTHGREEVYGGDLDLQLDLGHPYAGAKLYLLGGIGEYRTWTVLHQFSFAGAGCGYFCGDFGSASSVGSAWHDAWNAGFGAEFALGERNSLFVEAQYLRILPYSRELQFVPLRVGLRF
jgi:hypothetical protein